jgi:hypothetical protein
MDAARPRETRESALHNLATTSLRSDPALPAPFGVPHRDSLRDQQSNAHASFGRGNLPFLPLARALAIGGAAPTVSRMRALNRLRLLALSARAPR